MSKDATVAGIAPAERPAVKPKKAGKASKVAKPPPDAIPLRGHLDKILEGLRRRIGPAVKGDVEAVHQSRVATRRLKAATDLLAPALPARELKPFRKVLRGLRRRLGSLRDADVMLGHVESIAAGPLGRPATRPALDWLAGRLREARAQALRDAQARIDRAKALGRLGLWWALRDALAEAEPQLGGLLALSLRRQTDTFAALADRLADATLGPAGSGGEAVPEGETARRGGEAFGEGSDAPGDGRAGDAPATPADGSPASVPTPPPGLEPLAAAPPAALPDDAPPPDAVPLDPHAVRIAGKLLRYALELAEAHGHALPRRVAKSFKQMQEALGAWHDAVVLAERAMQLSVRDQLALHDSATQQGVLSLAGHFLRRSDIELARFARLWRSRGRELSATIHRAAGDDTLLVIAQT